MYNTSNAIISTGETGNYLPAGINENVLLKEVVIDKTPNGITFLKIIFEKDGKITQMDEWENKKGNFVKTDEDLQKQNNLQFGRILQIINCFYDKLPEVQFNSFIDMINWVKDTIDQVITQNKNLRLKITYDNKGFTKVSKHGIFVEPMDIKDSRIILTGRDKITKPNIKIDNESIDPLTNNSTPENTENSNDGLPF